MPEQRPNNPEQNHQHSKEQFGIFQDMPVSSQTGILSSLQNQKNHWQITLENHKNILDIERQKLAEILLDKDKTTEILNKLLKSQAYMQECILNPSRYPKLKKDDVSSYIKILPQNKQHSTEYANRLKARNTEQQECESNIIRLENEIADLEYKLEINQHTTMILRNTNTLFSIQLTNNLFRKPEGDIHQDAQRDLSHKRYPKQ